MERKEGRKDSFKKSEKMRRSLIKEKENDER